MNLSGVFPKDISGIHFHFVGIKGTGMAALVEILHARGAVITGSDVEEKFYTDEILEKLGIKKVPEESPYNFASISGRFVDVDITDADSAILAAQSAASQLALSKATDELSLYDESTVGDFTYYRLQQNYLGIPVYGKSIVVVADSSGEAKEITSNAVDIPGISVTPQVSVNELSGIVGKQLKFAPAGTQPSNDVFYDSAELVVYVEPGNKSHLAYAVARPRSPRV